MPHHTDTDPTAQQTGNNMEKIVLATSMSGLGGTENATFR